MNDPNPRYQTAKPRLLPNGWVEVDAVRWAGMLQTATYFATPKSEREKTRGNTLRKSR